MELPEMKKCSKCKCSFTLNLFRSGHNQCKPCAQELQNKNRRDKYKNFGMRKDPTRLISEIEAKAMRDLWVKCGWTQDKIGEAFNVGQEAVSANVRKQDSAPQ